MLRTTDSVIRLKRSRRAVRSTPHLLELEPRTLLTTYSFAPIDFPGARESYAFGINDSGAIVGYYVTQSGQTHAFLKDAGGFHSFDTTLPGAVLTVAYGINNSGQIVGMYRDGSSRQHAFLQDGGSYTELVTPFGARETNANGINNTGQITGTYAVSNEISHGFVLSQSGYTSVDPPSSDYTMGGKVNDAGQFVGAYADSSGAAWGFLWDGSNYTVIDASPLGATLTQALGINDQGQVVGIYRDPSGHDHGFIKEGVSYASLDASSLGARLTQAQDINESGNVVGVYIDSNGQIHGYLATPTAPLPPPIQVVDDGGAGFTTIGTWASSSLGGFQGDSVYSAAGNGADTATWTFNVTPGRTYRVMATWPAHGNRATNAPFTVLDGSTALGTVAINQRVAPNDATAEGAAWEILGSYAISGGQLVVRLSDAANGVVGADAVRIEEVLSGQGLSFLNSPSPGDLLLSGGLPTISVPAPRQGGAVSRVVDSILESGLENPFLRLKLGLPLGDGFRLRGFNSGSRIQQLPFPQIALNLTDFAPIVSKKEGKRSRR